MDPAQGTESGPGPSVTPAGADIAAEPPGGIESPADVELLARVESEMDAVESSLAALAAEDTDPAEVVAWLPSEDRPGDDGGTTPAS